MIKGIVFLFLVIFSLNVYANGYDRCYEQAAERYSVPEVLLRIISEVESSNNPYAVNISGKSYHLDNPSKAKELIVNNSKRNMDIGIMQINSWWFKRYKYNQELGLNACWNIYMGAYILGYEYRRHKDIWRAVAYYHSPNKVNQKKYINKIYKEVLKWQSIR